MRRPLTPSPLSMAPMVTVKWPPVGAIPAHRRPLPSPAGALTRGEPYANNGVAMGGELRGCSGWAGLELSIDLGIARIPTVSKLESVREWDEFKGLWLWDRWVGHCDYLPSHIILYLFKGTQPAAQWSYASKIFKMN